MNACWILNFRHTFHFPSVSFSGPYHFSPGQPLNSYPCCHFFSSLIYLLCGCYSGFSKRELWSHSSLKFCREIFINFRIKPKSSAEWIEAGHLRPSAPAPVPSQAHLDTHPPHAHNVLHLLLHSCFLQYIALSQQPLLGSGAASHWATRIAVALQGGTSPALQVVFTRRQASEQKRRCTMLAKETARHIFLLSDLFSFSLNKRKDLYILVILNIVSLEMFFIDMYVSYSE